MYSYRVTWTGCDWRVERVRIFEAEGLMVACFARNADALRYVADRCALAGAA